jgi:phosphosulfolactate synthase (CoM biosynthesis protein A)
MKKADMIERYGEEAYEKVLEQGREKTKKYKEEHPEQVKADNRELNRKGGKYYDKHQEYQHTGLQGARNRIRSNHRIQYKPYKDIIAPDSQIHHEWVPDSTEYRGIALVETDAHMHGFVDVIEILDGEITLLTEEQIKMGKRT